MGFCCEYYKESSREISRVDAYNVSDKKKLHIIDENSFY